MNLSSLIARIERGAMRALPPGVVLAVNAMLHQRLGEPELKELPRLVRPGTVAVDVGAHFGTYSVALARIVGKGGRVIAIEPIPEDAALLERGARALRLPISVVECAASDAEGTATLRVPLLGGAQKTALSSLEAGESTGASAAERRSVRTRRLDDMLAGIDLPVSFIKIDVEGHELAVLEGAGATIRQHRPNLLVEINDDPGKHDATEVIARIEAMGYRGEFLEGGRQRRLASAFDPDRFQHTVADRELSKAYVNNFMFTPVHSAMPDGEE